MEKTGKVNAKLAAKADTLKLVVASKDEQTLPVVLTVKHTGRTIQKRNQASGDLYVTHVYECEGDDLSVEQYKADSLANGFDPVNRQTGNVEFRARRVFSPDCNKLVRSKGGFWHVDERRAITKRQLKDEGLLSEEEIQQTLDKLFPDNTAFGSIGSEE